MPSEPRTVLLHASARLSLHRREQLTHDPLSGDLHLPLEAGPSTASGWSTGPFRWPSITTARCD
jgi:hypothetical protein